MLYPLTRKFLVLGIILISTFATQAQVQEVETFLNKWHEAAANANAEVFCGSMTDNSIYMGTDATERWTKTEFITFAKPYFDR